MTKHAVSAGSPAAGWQPARRGITPALVAAGDVRRPGRMRLVAGDANGTDDPGHDLFPANQAMAYDAFVAGTSSYPAAALPPAATIAAQAHASAEWFDGTDPAGRRTARISVPALIADGTADWLDAASNSRAIARLIPAARLVLYPDAGHAFLSQEGTTFTVQIESFLTAPPGPQRIAATRRQFLASEALVSAAGKTWTSKLKALHSPATSVQVARIDQPLASALTRLDSQLLSSGATGSVRAAILAFVDADERLIDDVVALSVQDSSMLGTWN